MKAKEVDKKVTEKFKESIEMLIIHMEMDTQNNVDTPMETETVNNVDTQKETETENENGKKENGKQKNYIGELHT